MLDFAAGEPIYQERGDQAMTPASVLKLLTAEAVLVTLGPQSRFVTELYAAPGASWEALPPGHRAPHGGAAAFDGASVLVVEHLYLKGYGDPMLVSEEWAALVAALPPLRIRGAIVVDDSHFARELGIVQEPGVLEPYNARNGAFASNYNTLAFGVDRGQLLTEAQTPATPFTRFVLRPLRRRWFSVELQPRREHLEVIVSGPVATRRRGFRIHLGFDPADGARYAGHLFQAIYNREHGAALAAPVRLGCLPADARLLYQHRSGHTVSDAVTHLMGFSNNFLANQLLLAAGAQAAGPPATLDKGLAVVTDIAARHGIGPLVLREGSGLDPANRLSACGLARFLQAAHLGGSGLQAMLQRYGQAAAKTGTFEAFRVRTLAGYLLRPDGTPGASFALLCNGPGCDAATHARYKADADGWARFLFGPAPETSLALMPGW